MTRNARDTDRKRKLVFLLAATTSVAWGCSGNLMDAPSSDSPNRGAAITQDAASLDCGRNAEAAHEVLNVYCASCHAGDGANQGGFGFVLDARRLRDTGKVVPESPGDSPMFRRVSQGEMPPASVGNEPSDAEVAVLEEWIACGAPDFVERTDRTRVTVADVVEALASDLADAPNDAERRDYRYILLNHLYNSGISDELLDLYRGAVSLLTNSLSQSDVVIRPTAVDPEQTIFRIQLSDYGWDADTWEAIVAGYPYAVEYSASFVFREDVTEDVRTETGTDIPFIFGDWFVENASVPPRYYQALGIPATLDELEDELNLNLDANIEAGLIARAGFVESGVSQANRVMERHEMELRSDRIGERQGGFWITYDFAGSVAERNIFENPLTFQSDGGEAIYDLPNGLHAYVLLDEVGNRIDEAPQAIVLDPDSRDGAVRPGASCMGCHDGSGIIRKEDEIRAFAEASLDFNDRNAVLSIYPPPEEMDQLQQQDGDRFLAARAEATSVEAGARPVVVSRLAYEAPLVRADAAAAFGLAPEEFEAALADDSLPIQLLTLRNGTGTIPRDVFEAVFGEAAEAIGIGAVIRTPDAPPQDDPTVAPEPGPPAPEPNPGPEPAPEPTPPPPPANACVDTDLGSDAAFAVSGDTAAAPNDTSGSCGGRSAGEIHFGWVAPRDGTFVFSTTPDFDTVLYVLDACGGNELACSNPQRQFRSEVTVDVLEGQELVIVVDGARGNSGSFELAGLSQ